MMKKALLTETLLTYLTHRQGVGLRQQLEKQIQDECDYWEHVLGCVIAVIRTLAGRGLAFRGTEERPGSWQNGNFLGLLELISQFDPFSRSHFEIWKFRQRKSFLPVQNHMPGTYSTDGSEGPHAYVEKVKTSGYFSLPVDSTPDLSHIHQVLYLGT